MVVRGVLPDGLAAMAPGPDLAMALAGVDRSRLNGHDLVELLRARARQVAYEQAQLLADLVEVVHSGPGPADAPVTRKAGFDECDVFEVAAALCWTRRATERQLTLATGVVERLPAVHAALAAGVIDVPRAWVFATETCHLDEDAARRAADVVLPVAGELTTGQVRARLRRAVITADPDAARVRHAQALTRRGVALGVDSGDHTATVSAWGLPPDRAVAAMERLSALAIAARNAGDPRGIDQLRADLLLDLLDGTHAGPAPVQRRGVVELTVPLTTLMGLSEQPGDLAGWGPVIADLARQVTDQRGPESTWRFTVTDEAGAVVAHGTTHRRPSAAVAQRVRVRSPRCIAPGCRMPASRCDLDHRRRHADGGPTTPENLQPLCRWHHRCKDGGGWRVGQADDGLPYWISPRHHTYPIPTDRGP